ncbi:MAG: iron-sulfur cluster assembly scaffold protein [Ignavibacteriales bacterium]|jgi:nitrogen fixation NifU-like protein
MEMNREERMELILDHYENPRNYGTLDNAQVVKEWGNPGCGDIVTIYLNVDDEGHIKNATFLGEGCTVSQAAASMITEIITGKTLDEVEAMGPDVILDILGQELGMARPKCTTLGLTTAKLAVKELRRQKMLADIEKEEEKA